MTFNCEKNAPFFYISPPQNELIIHQRRKPDNDMDQLLARPAQRRRIEEQEPDLHNRNF